VPVFRKFHSLLQNLFLQRRREADLDQEIRSHLDMLVEERVRAGMPEKAAQRAARIEIGGVEQLKEQIREAQIGNWMQSLSADLRHGLRRLRNNRMFMVVAALTLALGIGANTAIFSVIYGVLIRPLAVPEARQVVQVVLKEKGTTTNDAFTYNEFRHIQEHSEWPTAVAAFTHVGLNLSASSGADRVSALHVSSDYFRVTGAAPVLGRAFGLDEDRDPGARVAILSCRLWQRRFSGSEAVLGSVIHLNGAPYEVIGVMPASSTDLELDWVPPAFGGLQEVDLWTTLAPVADSIGSGENLSVVSRVRPDISLGQATAQLSALSAPFAKQYLEGEARSQSLGLSSVQEVLSAGISTHLWILLGTVALVLLISCANVSNLLLAQGAARMREVAVRAAMGASRGRLVRQFLIESMILSGLGCILGFLAAKASLALLLRFAPIQLPRVAEIQVDGRAFLFALAAAIFACALSAIVPAYQTARADASVALKETSARTTCDLRTKTFRRSLVIAEIALSMVLVIGASLLGQTFLNLLRVNPGFEPSGLLSAEIWLTGSRYRSTADLAGFYENLTSQIRRLPGVEEAAVVSLGQPLERGGNTGLMVNGISIGAMNCRVVTASYFQTLRTPIKRGRDFSALDTENAQPVAMVNESFVKHVLKDSDPFVATVQTGQNGAPRRIVGVAGDTKSNIAFPAQPTVFVPASETPPGLVLGFDVWFPTHILVRTAGDPQTFANQVSAVVRKTDSTIPVGRILTMEQVLARSLAIQRFMMAVVSVFAFLALALAAIGIYGVISFTVLQRTQELGIRMALGASRSAVLGLVVREIARLTAYGAAAGILVALALRQVIASVLFGVRPTDPGILAMTAACLLVVVTAACYIPARRAAHVDPAIALRYE
jgi:putative ABC transport system permease protein